MFPLTPDQHHWLEVATEDEGYVAKSHVAKNCKFLVLHLHLIVMWYCSLVWEN